MITKNISVLIRWGTAFSERKRYYFKTIDELEAFLLGADESSGWQGYDVKKSSVPLDWDSIMKKGDKR